MELTIYHMGTDYYCDPPMTPQEVEEERNDIYPA